MKASEEVKGEPSKKRISLEDLIEDVLLSSSSSSSADHQQQFNLAAVYFHRHDFYKSLLILADLFLHINSIQALHVRLRICFLYLETILRIKSAIEIMFSSAENEDFLQTAQKIFSTLHEIRDDIKTSSSSSSSLLRSMIDFRVYLYKCRVFSLLRNHMRSCRREIKNAMELFQHELRPCLENDTSSSSESLKELTQSGAFSSSLENQNQLALILKANLEYQRSNYRKALKLLTSSHLKDQDIYMGQNNVACIYFKMGKYPAAALFFHESLQLLNAANKSTEENAVGAEENGEEEFRMVATLKQSYTVDVVYNYALALQHSDRPREALTMFQSISTSYLSSKIMLWLRMGECAIAIHHQSEAKLAASVGSFRFGL